MRRTVPEFRIRHNRFQTPVVTYTGPGGRPAVTVIGTMHIGDRAYYSAIHDLAVSLERDAGAIVQYEAVHGATGDDWAAASDSERADLDALDDAFAGAYDYAGPLIQRLGWTTQISEDWLRYERSWENTDMNDLELIRAAGPGVLSDWSKPVRNPSPARDHPRLIRADAASFTFLMRIEGYRQNFPGARARTGPADTAIVADRNRRALDSIPRTGIRSSSGDAATSPASRAASKTPATGAAASPGSLRGTCPASSRAPPTSGQTSFFLRRPQA